MVIHHSEWLSKAKNVPVGQKRRTDHGCGATKSLDVFNNPDSWSAYCHRCKTSGQVRKDYYTPIPKDVIIPRKYCSDTDLCTLPVLAQKQPLWFKRVVVLLHHKGVSLALLEAVGATVRYNLKDHRLVLRFKGVDIGRDCTGQVDAKWLVYHKDDGQKFVYLQGEKTQGIRERVAVTEDLFSAAKIRYYTGLSSMSLLGTSIDDTKALTLADKHVLICTDGDQAGLDCARALRKRLQPLGVPCDVRLPPDGLDPKDLNPEELKELLR